MVYNKKKYNQKSLKETRASVITVGEEIMIGQILDTNTRFISARLNEIGVTVVLKASVGDRADEITGILKYAESLSEIILVTGGLGPTNDDITRNCLAEYFNSEIRLNERAYKEVKAYFEKRGLSFTPSNQRQAFIPEIASVISNEMGTAPGLLFEKSGKIFVVMPGVPHEMEHMTTTRVIPLIKERFELKVIRHQMIMTAGIGESWLAEKIAGWEKDLPSYISLAYLPGYGQVRLRLSATGEDPAKVDESLKREMKSLRALIPEYIFSEEDESLEARIGGILRDRKMTLSVAESCTGGYLSHMLTSIPGSSDYFIGSVVAYQNDIKERYLGVSAEMLSTHGAVSEETATAMAQGARKHFHTDYALATSGIAGPGGGTPEKPVGTVWIAFASAETAVARKFNFPKDRVTNIRFSAVSALVLLWQRISLNHGRNG